VGEFPCLRDDADGCGLVERAVELGSDRQQDGLRGPGPRRFTRDVRQAVADADFVQENAPERRDLKVELFAEIDDATRPDVIIASSSSSITMSVIQAGCRHPERTVIAHPFNPPHIVPLVEVVGGTRTDPADDSGRDLVLPD
jgi:3-hydroxyacyl-CoA dehydrogenase